MEFKAIWEGLKYTMLALSRFFRWLETRDWKRLGQLETEQKYDQAADDAVDAVVAARDERLSDDQAFGPNRKRK